MKTKKPNIETHGPIARHNQACAVLHSENQPAVYNLGTGIFHPSWKAQEKGYRLIKAATPFQRFLLRFF